MADDPRNWRSGRGDATLHAGDGPSMDLIRPTFAVVKRLAVETASLIGHTFGAEVAKMSVLRAPQPNPDRIDGCPVSLPHYIADDRSPFCGFQLHRIDTQVNQWRMTIKRHRGVAPPEDSHNELMQGLCRTASAGADARRGAGVARFGEQVALE